jgi:multicomponent Na+:H+ antiporter subunit G
MSELGIALVALGASLLVVSAIGLFRLEDALARQHAATKSGTLAQGLILIGVAFHESGIAWWWRVGLLLFVLVFTLPIASQMLARAAVLSARTRDLPGATELLTDQDKSHDDDGQ